jgi:ABC-type antimicrobial peptide transport system permease subunit
LKLKLIGGLENSVFQGNVIIAEDLFVKAFPSVSGGNLFLVKSPTNKIDMRELQEGWRHYGAEITTAKDRLISFNRIENTYLNIFLMLGALGLLIGTAGLGIIIFRITLEQIPEYALLQSIGFTKSKIYRIILTEKNFVILSSVLIGIIPGTMSAFPFLIASSHSGLWIWLPSVSFLIISCGIISASIAIRLALKNNLITSLVRE